MGALTAMQVKSLAIPGMHGDGGGLCLRVSPTGAKSWIQRITIGRRRRDIGLGDYPAVPLARARLLANANRAAVAAGLEPLAAKRRAKVPTFREAAEAVFALNRVRWRNGKHTKSWWLTPR